MSNLKLEFKLVFRMRVPVCERRAYLCQEQTNRRIKKMINEAEWIKEERKEILKGRSMGFLPLFWEVFFFRFFFAQYAGMVQKTLLVKKKLGPSYKKFRDRGHFLGTCLILWKLCKKSREKTKIFPETMP